MNIVDKRMEEKVIVERGDIIVSSSSASYYLVVSVVENGEYGGYNTNGKFTAVNLSNNCVIHECYAGKTIEEFIEKFEGQNGKITSIIKQKDFDLVII